jgi:hypothetical protein
MPPGLTRTDIRNNTLSAMYMAMQSGAWASAAALLPKVKAKTEVDSILVKFFSAAIDAEVDWFFQGITALDQVGDVYEYKRRIEEGQQKFKGIADYDEKIGPWLEKISGEEVARPLLAGQLYHKIAASGYEKAELEHAIQQFLKLYADTQYAEAAKIALAEEKVNYLGYFLKKYPMLCQYEYPPIVEK